MKFNDRIRGIPALNERRGGRKVVGAVLGLMALFVPFEFAADAGGGPPVRKPQVPIRLEINSGGPVSVGAPVTITLTVTPLVPSQSVTTSITLPDGIRLLDGDTDWSGSLEKDQSHVVTITVLPDRAALFEVKAKAVLTLVSGSQMSRHAAMTLDLDPNKPKPNVRKRSGPGGESILEIPVQSGPEVK